MILPHDETGSGPPVVLLHAGVAGAGHLASLETPESCRAIVLEFLAT